MPVEKFRPALSFLSKLAQMIAQTGLARKRELEAIERDRIYKQIVTTVEEGIIVYGPDLRYLEWNPYMERLSGKSESEVLGKHPLELFPFLKDAGVIEGLKKTLKGETAEPKDFPYYLPWNGKRGWTMDKSSPLKNAKGEIIGVTATVLDITGRKKAEEKFRTLYENMEQGVFYQLADGRLTDINPAGLSMFGLTGDQFFGRTSYHPEWKGVDENYNILKPEDHPSMRALKTGNTISKAVGVYNPVKKDYLWLSISAKPQFYPGEEKPFQVFVTMHDITERKLSEERYQTLFNEMLDGFALHEIICNSSGEPEDYRFISVNPAFEKMTGLDAHTITGRKATEILSGIEKSWIEIYGKVALTGKPAHFENYSRDLDRYFEVKAFRPSPGRFACIFTDITEKKKTEEKLRHQEQQIIGIFNSLQDAYFQTDIQGRFTVVSPSAPQIYGYGSAEEMIGLSADKLYYNSENRKELYNRLIEKGKVDDWITQARKKDGDPFWVSMSAQFVYDDEGKIRGTEGVVRDISDRKNMESQLLQAQKMESVGRLAGGVAHDFNNMLSAILGHAELAIDKTGESGPIYEDLLEIRKAAERSAGLTRQLLSFARKMPIKPVVLDFNETIEGMLKMLRRLIGENITLIWVPGSNFSSVKMDPSQIDQILANLIVNARDSITETGRITIETARIEIDDVSSRHKIFMRGEFACLRVSDNGCGMNRETAASIFEPFFTTKDKGRGTGLGLPTVYGIVKQNNGFIDVESEPGQGSIFSIYLPVFKGKEDKFKEKELSRPASRGSGTILLVEDEPAILDVTESILTDLGYTVIAAASPQEAEKLAEKHGSEIELLITDVIMPGMNGSTLEKKLKINCPGLKSLFMSGYTADIISEHGILDKDLNFIQKPFSIRDLSEKVKSILEN